MKKNALMKKQLVPGSLKKPAWLKLRVKCGNEKYSRIKKTSTSLKLATVCSEASCPNISECWSRGTATFMIMGDTCTRACRFCNVNHGKPRALDPDEPKKLAESIAALDLSYAVVTCVDRDDLPDFGARHFAQCIKEIKTTSPKTKIEILAGDFRGNLENLKIVIDAAPDVFGHNIETVESLQKKVRDARASYKQSLKILKAAKSLGVKRTKSSIMVGLGESKKEVEQTMKDLRAAKVDFLTIGQYLRPSAWNLPVAEFITPSRFELYRQKALRLGFAHVAAGPFVRSSYKAHEALDTTESLV